MEYYNTCVEANKFNLCPSLSPGNALDGAFPLPREDAFPLPGAGADGLPTWTWAIIAASVAVTLLWIMAIMLLVRQQLLLGECCIPLVALLYTQDQKYCCSSGCI